ncbi:GAF domain-containing protein [Stenomitos frigidus]|uniref:LuxR family transcriptional regulator n=1 Tax=Stenomitos frigidus ULC18 TaxID=2107698 RepID=A0A2T1EI40_9CYAN|nr:GAF domain-containing protein [Stenomitos frigidus]PSB32432.1 LuxR family transcriptional regulator [Stenomitos frigidus ULC18]
MPESNSGFLDSTQLLFDLQQGNVIACSLSGCLEPEAIARRVTDGMVAEFGCAFARIWLVEPDRTALCLVASSGMYTRIDGSFARVPMGAFKVGKIAQNGIPFLSNALADEIWVRDRDWAIANGIHGFAGYPLTAGGDVVGVLAVFSRQAMAPEFLEVLQSLCATVTIALEIALHHQQAKQAWHQEKQTWMTAKHNHHSFSPLSEQLAGLLANVRLTLVGTEIPLSAPLTYLFLRAAEILRDMQCMYCRLTYGTAQISLEAMASSLMPKASPNGHPSTSPLGELLFAATCLGGSLQSYAGADQRAAQVLLSVPYPGCVLGPHVHIQCGLPVLQMAFTQLAYLAGLTVCATAETVTVPVLTDHPALLETRNPILWVATQTQPVPKQASAKIDLTITPAQLHAAVEAVTQGETWGLALKAEAEAKKLSEREQEIMTLLAQGLRDRDIANTLYISDRTVKFHINNILVKLKAKTRFQALYQATRNGWINPENLERSQTQTSS